MGNFWYVGEFSEDDPVTVFKTEEEARFWVDAMNQIHPTKTYYCYEWINNG